MRAIFWCFHSLWGTKSQDSVHKPQPFWRRRWAEAESNRGPSAYHPNALPLNQCFVHETCMCLWCSRCHHVTVVTSQSFDKRQRNGYHEDTHEQIFCIQVSECSFGLIIDFCSLDTFVIIGNQLPRQFLRFHLVWCTAARAGVELVGEFPAERGWS